MVLDQVKKMENPSEPPSFVKNIDSIIYMEPNECPIFQLYIDGKYHNPPSQLSAQLNQYQDRRAKALSTAPNDLLFQSVSAWLKECDDPESDHECKKQGYEASNSERKLPTRLLNVSPSTNPNDLRLDDRENVKARSDRDWYIALSHCWGNTDPSKVPLHCTTRDNLETRKNRFMLDDLPKTFQDAVKVTRELGIQYLWIDSLCIIQGNGGDWDDESKKMEQVFASAYCTVAATSASDSYAGFLVEQVGHSGIYVQDHSDQKVYVSTIIANFDDDVEKAVLNRRAWVMQERLLSPRTIHFTSNQIYGECGRGIYYAGDRIFLRSDKQTKKYFQLDPIFPNRLRRSGFTVTEDFLRDLLEDYAQRDISKPTDRAVAISGLITRIENALESPVHHGIFEMFRHRNLLWKRCSGQKEMKRIEYEKMPPTWSWMAYQGGIQFLKNGFQELALFQNLRFERDGRAFATTVWEFVDLSTRLELGNEMRHELLDSEGWKGWIDLDEDARLPTERNIVVLAKPTKVGTDGCDYYVLLVRPIGSQGKEYERLGMGGIRKECKLKNKGTGYIL